MKRPLKRIETPVQQIMVNESLQNDTNSLYYKTSAQVFHVALPKEDNKKGCVGAHPQRLIGLAITVT
jgi:hypothetical protein